MRRFFSPALAFTGLLPGVLAAQSVASGDSALARHDTSAAIAAYQAAIRDDLHNAAAHYRLGLIYMAREHRERSVDDNRLHAEEQFRYATRFAPDSERYLAALAAVYRDAPEATLHIQVPLILTKAGTVALRHPSVANADILYRAGRAAWGRPRPGAPAPMPHDMEEFLAPRTAYDDWDFVDRFLNRLVQQDLDVGTTTLHEAEQYLRAALAADPRMVKAAELLMLMMLDQRRFTEAIDLGRRTTASNADSGRAWAALGTAQARENRWAGAQASFAKALERLSPAERAPYDDLGSLLSPDDSVRYEGMDPASQQRVRSAYWALQQPLFLTDRNEPRTEFYARVTEQAIRYADRALFASASDMRVRDQRLRWGPPQVYTVLGDQLWLYPHSRLHALWVSEGGEVSHDIGTPALDIYGLARTQLPASFDNVPANYNMDTIEAQPTQFRGDRPDSTDLAVFSFAPVGRMSAAAPRTELELAQATFLLDDNLQHMARRQDSVTIMGGDTLQVQRRLARFSAAPGAYLLRVEADLPAIERAARSQTTLDVRSFAGDALMMSTVLLAGNLAPKDSEPRRWTDFILEPSSGRLAPGQTVGLLWEIYNLLPDSDGVARYHVDLRITVKSIERHGLLSIIPGIIGDAIGISAKGDDAAALGYDRAVPATPRGTRMEFLTLNLQNAPNGEYEVEVRITDQRRRAFVSDLRRLVITPTPLSR